MKLLFSIRHGGSIAALLLGLGLSACSPMTEQEKAYFESRRELDRQEELLSQALAGSEAYGEHIEKVKKTPPPTGLGTTEAWIDTLSTREGGDIWFGRWQARAPSANQIEVRYTYTLLEEGQVAREKGLRWTVDTLMDTVSAPAVIPEEELGTRQRRNLAPREQLKERSREFSLE